MRFREVKQPARAGGQALVEFIVAAVFFLVPLFLAIVVLGKFSDVQHTADMAARYATWERTVWYDDAGSKFNDINGSNQKSGLEIDHEVAARLINDRSSAQTVIRKNDRNATGYINGIDPMWHDNEHRALLDNYNQQSVAVKRVAPSTNLAGGALAAVAALPLPKGVTGTIVPPVPNDTLALVALSFKEIGRNSQAYQRLWPKATVWGGDWKGLDFSAEGGILSNTWSANGAGATRDMVAESVPTAKGLGQSINLVVNAAKVVWDPLTPTVEFGRITPDVVPGDRLK